VASTALGRKNQVPGQLEEKGRLSGSGGTENYEPPYLVKFFVYEPRWKSTELRAVSAA
jgi:hypothetical protein